MFHVNQLVRGASTNPYHISNVNHTSFIVKVITVDTDGSFTGAIHDILPINTQYYPTRNDFIGMRFDYLYESSFKPHSTILLSRIP